MEYRKNEIRAGAFILISFTILVVMLVSVSDLQGLFKKKKAYKVLFSATEGIERNANVRYAGIRIGHVDRIRVVPELGGKVELDLEVYEDAVIKEDARAAIKTLGIVGKKYVEITGGSPGAKPLKPGSVMESEEALKMEDLTKTGLEVAAKVKHIADNLDRLLGDPVLAKNIKGTVANVQDVTASVRELTATLNQTLQENREPVTEALKGLPELMKKVDATVANLKELSSKGDATLGENRKQIDAAMENFKEVSKNIKELTEEVKKHPWKLLRKP